MLPRMWCCRRSHVGCARRWPSQYSLVMLLDQDLPVLARTPTTTHHALATGVDARAALGPTECVSTGIHRIGQHVQQRVVSRQLPMNVRRPSTYSTTADR